MALNLVETVKSLFTPELVSQASLSMGENESNVQRAFNGAIPASFAGILNKIGNGDASGVLGLARQALDTGFLNNPGSFSGNSNLLSLGSGLFGDKLGGIIRTIAGFAGIKVTSASAVLNLATPAALAMVGKQTSGASSPNALISLLHSQKESMLNAIPGGLNLVGALGLNSLSDITSNVSIVYSSVIGRTKSVTDHATTKRRSYATLWLVLLAVLAVSAWLLFGKSCKKTDPESTAPALQNLVNHIPNQLRVFSIPT
jgi:Bacterial protein of unknown function (DUF937)